VNARTMATAKAANMRMRVIIILLE
jgi:hypothetical protein